jgi:hypothetical protein
MKAAAWELAYKRKTPIWQFARPPAVPLYCDATPADFLPFLEKARLINHQDARFLPQVLQDEGAQVIAHHSVIPVSLV